jgi:hypothetical protein
MGKMELEDGNMNTYNFSKIFHPSKGGIFHKHTPDGSFG